LASTGWQGCTKCLKLQVIFCKRAPNYLALLRTDQGIVCMFATLYCLDSSISGSLSETFPKFGKTFVYFFFEFWQSSLAKSDLTISGSYTNRCYYILQFTATWPVMVGELQEGGGSAFIQFKIHTATRCNTLVNLSGWWSCSHEIQETYQQTATHCNKL